MESPNVREIARHQHLRQVELVELRDGQSHVRIVIRASRADVRQSHPEQPGRSQASGVSAPGPAEGVIVKSEGLGVLRLSHPMRVPVCVQPGDTVVAGQTMALLQLGDVYTAVVAPREGIIDTVLVSEGERIDFGKPLFRLKAAER